uniref:Pyridoxal phosphate homeostasis protein n=2 Tax=Ascaris TaxID=6251 RepID=A0A9J2PDJ3_ASCLU
MLLKRSFNAGDYMWLIKCFLRSRMSVANKPSENELDTVATNLRVVLNRLKEVSEKAQGTSRWCGRIPMLVAVSKTKHPDLVKRCYDEGQRKFGENYVQELQEKAAALANDCPHIEWHFIGQIQSNKIAKLAAIQNLHCVETLSSEKHCTMLDKEMAKRGRRINVYVQTNTSNEPQKGGATPESALNVAQFIREQCPSLRFAGFMTIGSFEQSSSQQPNADFDVLFDVRKKFCERTGVSEGDYDLSMGMSHDFETAVLQGSTSVRVGTTIFGSRLHPQ